MKSFACAASRQCLNQIFTDSCQFNPANSIKPKDSDLRIDFHRSSQ
jgi:hypothetical protein